MKKTMKIVSVLLVVMIAFALTTPVFATDVKLDWDNATKNVNETGNDGGAAKSVGKMANAILGVVQVVGMAVAVIMLVVLAIKYISAAPSDKAEIKKHAVVYVVGAVVLFGASGILQIVKNFATNIKA